MKKITCIMLAVLTGLLFVCAGCDVEQNPAAPPSAGNDPSGSIHGEEPSDKTEWTGWQIAEERPPRWTHAGIEFTAEEPVFDYGESVDEQCVIRYSNQYDSELGENTEFTRFIYDVVQIAKGMGGTECCILNPYYKADGWGFKADNREFSLYRTAKDELFVREAITITDMEYGTYGDCYLNGEVLPGNTPSLIHLEFVSSSQPRYDPNAALRLAFGKYPKNGSISPLYINFYSGEDCFATCYYRERIPVNYEWLYRYFKKNLFSVNGEFTFDKIP